MSECAFFAKKLAAGIVVFTGIFDLRFVVVFCGEVVVFGVVKMVRRWPLFGAAMGRGHDVLAILGRGRRIRKARIDGNDDGEDDVEQQRAGTASVLAGSWSRRSMSVWMQDRRFRCLHPDFDGSAGGPGEELPHRGGDLFHMGFESEVSGVEKLDGGVWVVALECLGAGRDEVGVVLAPDGEQRRLRFAEVLLEFGVELYVVGVVEEEIELDVHVAGARDQSGVEGVAFGRDHVGVGDAVGVLRADARRG